MGRAKPEIVELHMKDLEETLRRIEANQATAKDHEAIRTLSVSYVRLLEMLKDKNTKIDRLRKLLFGVSTEKTDAVLGNTNEPATSSSSAEDEGSESADEPAPEEHSKPPPKGHGCNGADAYHGAETIPISHESLQPGDCCPDCENGTLYETNRPGVLIRIVGQAPVEAKVYKLQKLRCNLCGKLFTAAVPEGIGKDKYDATVPVMIALLKYGSGLPFNRLAGLQGHLGIPLPASTQWDIIHDNAKTITPVYEELIRQAAQGDVLHNDDTTAKILELMSQRAKQAALAEETVPSSPKKPASERRGMFTSGIVSLCEGRHIALFFTGRQHAGENLKDVLTQRAGSLKTPLQMCDALSRNTPAELETIVANCLAHSRRQFVDVVDNFPSECRHVLEALKVIYKNDAVARKQNLSSEARLEFHQAKSGQVMKELQTWLTNQLDQKRVEPNSGLGQAMTYMLKHWEKLTRFLQEPGAPLDNNICERALKKAILHRKNALFYKTTNGAHVGDLHMSLIHTCELCGINPFDYLTELQRHADELTANPQEWMPWNYQRTLAM
jgi:transposase